jgi:four helix bundle protein
MTPQELRDRTFEFALQTYRFAKPLLRNIETRHVASQIIRASSSVAANYRAAGQGRSRREFCAKLGTVREEADESSFGWSSSTLPNLVPPKTQSSSTKPER